jgi:putative (di)nucleoside polyphosphate hydrolase
MRPTKPNDDFIERMLDDPLIQLLMQADKVDRDAMATLLRRASVRLSDAESTQAITVSSHLMENDQYRRGVGIMLLNPARQVFIAQRIDQPPGSWQMPQGGIDGDETPLQAALRELREETSIQKVKVLAETEGWLRYDFPPEVGSARGYRGQQQKWFAMLFLGEDRDIDLATEHPEFNAWRWAEPDRVTQLIIDFKRQLYREVTSAFSGIAPVD